jgi:hypothetical protein
MWGWPVLPGKGLAKRYDDPPAYSFLSIGMDSIDDCWSMICIIRSIMPMPPFLL